MILYEHNKRHINGEIREESQENPRIGVSSSLKTPLEYSLFDRHFDTAGSFIVNAGKYECCWAMYVMQCDSVHRKLDAVGRYWRFRHGWRIDATQSFVKKRGDENDALGNVFRASLSIVRSGNP